MIKQCTVGLGRQGMKEWHLKFPHSNFGSLLITAWEIYIDNIEDCRMYIKVISISFYYLLYSKIFWL